MLTTRPNTDDYIKITNDLAVARDQLSKREYQLEKIKAKNVRIAMQNKATTRTAEVVKVIGNNEEEEQELDKLNYEIIELKRVISLLFGKLELWRAQKDLYISDTRQMAKGTGFFSEESKEM
jgi:hypothetical protein